MLRKTAHDTMADQSRYINIISSDAFVLRKERQKELFGRKIKTCPFDLRLKTEPSPISLISRYML